MEHFQQAHKTNAYNDKIYNKLERSNIRDRILKEELRRNKCDNQSVYKFLKLLKQSEEMKNKQHF